MSQTLEQILERTQWFRQARFGLFLHWGLYAIPGRGEWLMSHDPTTYADYQQYALEFNPVHFNPQEWARQAKQAGMQYVVLTAKHHDGFCLFDSQYTDYTVMHTPYGRDIVAEYVEAIRSEGLKVGLYFSLIDWSHPDYPSEHDNYHPLRGKKTQKEQDFQRYLTFLHQQVEEIVTRYGRLDILWFDFSYDSMFGDTWRAQALIEMVRRYQPHVIIDNRLETSGEGFGSIVTETPTDYCGDFVSPEQIIPTSGIRNFEGQLVPWELCTTMNNHWGYNPMDYQYKSSKMLIRKLVECVSKGGNMMLNIGPDALGCFNSVSQKILKEIGDWMQQYGDSIYGCTYAELEKPEWGYYTRKDNRLYAHIFDAPIGVLPLSGIEANQIKSVRWLHDGSAVRISDSWTVKAYPDTTFVQFGDWGHFTYPIPNDIDSVLEITLKET